MKTITLILISLFLSFFAGNDRKSDTQKQNLKGRVKKITQSHYLLTKAQTDSLINILTVTFNAKGNITGSENYNPNGQLLDISSCKYDNKDTKIEAKSYNTAGNLYLKSFFKYDSKGNISEESKFHKDSSLFQKIAYEYDSKNNVVKETTYNKDGSLLSTVKYKYDDAGNEPIEIMEYKSDGSINYKITCQYDGKENKTEEDKYPAGGNSSTKNTYKYEYDSSGNWKMQTEYSNDKPVESTAQAIEYY